MEDFMRFPIRPALFLCFLLFLPTQVYADHGGLQRLALLVGANNGGPARTRLLHAHSDAHAFGKVLRDLGGVEEDRQILLTQPSVATVRHHFAELGRRLGAINATGARAEFLFYYSGHSDERSLLLDDERLDYSTLRELLEKQPATVRIAILDSCASGALTRLKGGQWQLPFMVDASTSVQGHAFLTSASAEESAQESDRLGGSIFTHYLLSGLRGAADTSKDSRITLGEAYTYAFNETLTRTQVTQAGPQHPHYEMQLSGSGDVVLTDLRGISAALVLPEALGGRLYIEDANGALVAEINKPIGRAMKIGLGPGRYRLTLERPAELRTGWLTIAEEGETVLEREPHLAAPFVDAGKLLLEVDGRGGHAGEQRLMEVAAVHAQVRRAEEALRHRQLAQDLARVPDAVEMRVGLKRRPAHAVLDADAPGLVAGLAAVDQGGARGVQQRGLRHVGC